MVGNERELIARVLYMNILTAFWRSLLKYRTVTDIYRLQSTGHNRN